MSVGHGGGMSKHPAWVKVAILDFLQRRFNDDKVSQGIRVTVYDPFNSDMDFFIHFEETSWDKYVELYWNYYRTANTPETRGIAEDVANEYAEKASKHGYIPEHMRALILNALSEYIKPDEETKDNMIWGTFNASTSKTWILYKVENMVNILETGKPYR